MKKELYILTEEDIKNGIFSEYKKIKQFERENKQLLPFSERKWLEIFPECEHLIIKKLENYKIKSSGLKLQIKQYLTIIHKQCKDESSLQFWRDVVKYFFIEDLEKLTKKIKTIEWSLIKKSGNGNGITDEMIERAKQYPFEQLIEADKAGFAPCPFHREENSSFYIKGNFGYCFGCGKSCDTIQFIMDKNNMNFIDAVKFLSNY